MSTNVSEEAVGGDGLGADAMGDAPPDGSPDDLIYDAEGGVDSLDNDDLAVEVDEDYVIGTDSGGRAEPATSADPWAGADAATKELAEKKGWKSPADMAASYAELERARGRDSSKVGELEKQLGAIQEQLQAAAQPQGEGEPHPLAMSAADWNALNDAAKGDPLEAQRIFYEQVLMPGLSRMVGDLEGQFNQQVGEIVRPVASQVNNMTWKEMGGALMQEYPDYWPRVATQVAERVQNDPELRKSPAGLRQAALPEIMKLRQDDLRRGRSATEGETLIGGRSGETPMRGAPVGSTEAPADLQEQIRESIFASQPAIKDFLS